MKASEIYFKTMKFVWMKLGLGILFTVVSAVIMLISLFLGYLIGGFGYIVFLSLGLAGVGLLITGWDI